MSSKDFVPNLDGINHINVYSKGKTELGKLLSNFAHTPFIYKKQTFQSVEGWWYYRMTLEEKLMDLYGYEAKEFGKKCNACFTHPDKEELKEVYCLKLYYNTNILVMLSKSVLPFTHYYVSNNKKVSTKWEWTATLWNEIRESLK